MHKYFTSILVLFFVFQGFGQQKKDSTDYKTAYGIRLGIDLSKPILGLIDKNYSGFEVVADYRLRKNMYLAAEIGNESNTTTDDYFATTAKGSYAKVGVNINAYQNWLDMNNEILVGFRYAFSNFDQTLNSYTINTGSDYFPGDLNSVGATSTDLKAHWAELVLGVKAETLKNLYLGFSISYNILFSVDDPQGFKTLYVPGFNRVFESKTGFGFNYTISYTIPFFKK
ncbi:hypothetical protein GCM10011416_23020 [Polaribacter pacificus]|uniref:Uncharacterized protein n=1 Tax=Polaribacter pacificus TaxID=1775173 RepID=A0A917I346_9FLAO|nr:DUF6048 family protein [Polaribacter pacificus]GGH03477.1 hypothetical protein GCM10011416_23020 [Polaribacter pacificus]